jgi:fructose-1-phosphate kinase PfkB-like protein
MVFSGDEDETGATVQVQCPEAGEVAVHVNPGDAVLASVYMTPEEAEHFAEQVRFAAWAARILADEKGDGDGS